MNSVSLFQSCDDFQKHCRGNSILTPEDPQKKKEKKKKWGNAKKKAKIVHAEYFCIFCMTTMSVSVFCTSGPGCYSVYSL